MTTLDPRPAIQSMPSPRSSVVDLPIYRPKLTAKRDGPVIRLSANEGALGPSPKAVVAMADAAASMHRYPTGEVVELAEALGACHGLDPARMVFGCGSDELIVALCTAYLEPDDEVVVNQFGFAMYPLMARAAGGVPVVAQDRDYRVDVDAMLAAVGPRTKIVFLANPNNPTGSYLSRSEVARLHAGLPGNVLLVIDSAYAEYVTRNDYADGSDMAERFDNVIMLRTFSKMYAMAGLRLGWGYGPAHVLDAIAAVKQPFGANVVAVAAGIAAVGDTEFQQRALEHNETWRTWTVERLTGLGLSCLPSVANFVMVRFPDDPARDAAAAGAYLAERGIFIRDMASYGAPEYMRFSIGTEEEMRSFIDAVAAFLGQGGAGR